METMPPILQYPSLLPPRPVARWRPWVAWVVILFCLGYFAIEAGMSKAENAPNRSTYAEQELSARYALGAHLLGFDRDQKDLLSDTVTKDAHTPAEILRAAIVLREIKGSDAALAMLKTVPADPGGPNGPLIAADARLLQTLLAPDGKPSPDEIARLKEHYGWFGDLVGVLGKPDQDPDRVTLLNGARRTTIAGMTEVVLGVVGIALGLVALTAGIILIALGKFTFRFTLPRYDATGASLLEGFAIYLLMMASMGIMSAAGVRLPLWVQWVATIGMLPAVAGYVRLCGTPWAEVCKRTGLTRGDGVLMEMACGVAGYIAVLPVMGVGILLSIFLAKIAHVDTSHPIVGAAAGASAWQWVELWLLACVIAPITEEFFFRGALFSWMRGRCNWVISAGVVSLIFAGLHPQGWAAIPVLGSLAMGLAALREWRKSLIASMTAHALNNAIATATLMLMLS